MPDLMKSLIKKLDNMIKAISVIKKKIKAIRNSEDGGVGKREEVIKNMIIKHYLFL